MIDPDLKSLLEVINQNLNEIKKRSGHPGILRSFFNGMFGALGYVFGIVLVAIILIWFSSKMGWLSSFEQQAQNFSDVINQAKNLTSPALPTNGKTTTTGSASSSNAGGGDSLGTFTLPNGQKLNLTLPSGY
jgi:hypothetical protein